MRLLTRQYGIVKTIKTGLGHLGPIDAIVEGAHYSNLLLPRTAQSFFPHTDHLVAHVQSIVVMLGINCIRLQLLYNCLFSG